MRLTFATLLLAAAVPGATLAQSAAVPDPPRQPRLTVETVGPDSNAGPDDEALAVAQDLSRRMLLPVRIGGAGPFRFIVDTGAERTSISRELATSLNLAAASITTVHSMTESSRVQTYLVPSLQFGSRELTDIRAPAFFRTHLGADGVLGADALERQRVLFDFARQEISIAPAAAASEHWPSDTIVITGRRRHGRLILVDAAVEGHRVWVIVDTGSEVTIANPPLQRLLERRTRNRQMHDVVLHSVTGGRMSARYTFAREVQIGGVRLRELPIAFADVRPFEQLDLNDRPAILLGMDALQLFERVSVDFRNRRVRLLVRPGSVRDEEPIWSRAD